MSIQFYKSVANSTDNPLAKAGLQGFCQIIFTCMLSNYFYMYVVNSILQVCCLFSLIILLPIKLYNPVVNSILQICGQYSFTSQLPTSFYKSVVNSILKVCCQLNFKSLLSTQFYKSVAKSFLHVCCQFNFTSCVILGTCWQRKYIIILHKIILRCKFGSVSIQFSLTKLNVLIPSNSDSKIIISLFKPRLGSNRWHTC